MPGFIGRQAELERLVETTQKSSASFIVVRGRRRIGKSRLIEEFAKGFANYYVFAGLPPEKHTTAKHQLDEFARQMARQFHTASAQYQDWSDALWAIGERVQTGKVLLFFDEISWMGSKDPTFLGKIKNAWDQQFKKNDRLVFVVCGSASSWIEENLLSSTGFVGRISYTLTLEELPLPDCNRFWPDSIAAYEKFKILSVTGGVPKYLEEIDPKRGAEENIKRLCFTRGGFLVEEFEQVFSDVFLRDSEFYKKILEILCAGAKEMPAIKRLLTGNQHGRVSEYLRELELAGFVTRDHTWDLKNGTDARLSRFRLKDNYLRFYLKYVKKNLGKIDRDGYALKSLTSLPEWPGIMGLQFENLVLNNRRQLHRLLRLSPEEIVNENPFYQHKTARQPGCQIDYLIQTKFDTLYVCEIKFSRNEITSTIIPEIRAKIGALSRPRGMSCRPVLIHVNGVSEEVTDSDYFAHIVDMGGLLN
jgi:AAA+ ATPase superfamily predicted ATPase